MTKKLKVLSLFDGISCGQVALERAGMPVEVYYASEIDKYAIQVTQKNYPNTIQLGDVTQLDFTQFIGKIDIIIGGSPCQDLSIAKQNRKGLHGERSKLFWKYVEALQIIKPKYFLLENVASMKQEDRDAITETLKEIYPNTECIMINSALVSAQQRKRYYWTNWKVNQPSDQNILLNDILETNVTTQQTLTERYGLKGFKLNDEKANCLTASCYKGYGNDGVTLVAEPIKIPEATKKGYVEINVGECVDLTQPNSKTRRGRSMVDKSNCLMASEPQYYHYLGKINKPIRVDNLEGLGKGQANRVYSVQGKLVCLNANWGEGGVKTGLHKIDLPDGDYIIRKLTPIECERLQTLPDNYTNGISNTQRYKALGNGWTVDVIAHIFGGLKNEI